MSQPEDKSYKITEIKAWPPGTAVPKIQGLIKACKPPEEKQTDYGLKISQWAVLQQGGEEISLYNDSGVALNKGDAVTLACVNEKGKMIGVTSYLKGDKWALQLKSRALVLVDAVAGQRTAAQQAPQQAPAAPGASYTPPAQQNAVNGQETDVLGQLSSFWNACRREAEKNPTFKEETIQSKTSCLFIEGCRQQLWKGCVPEPRPVNQPPQAPAPNPPSYQQGPDDLPEPF